MDRSYRLLLIAWIAQFIASFMLLWLAATRDYRTFPVWVGWLDVGLSLTLLITGVIIKERVKEHIQEHDISISYQIMQTLLVLLLLVLWWFREHIDFNYLTGVAWRFWLLMYCLPSLVRLIRH